MLIKLQNIQHYVPILLINNYYCQQLLGNHKILKFSFLRFHIDEKTVAFLGKARGYSLVLDDEIRKTGDIWLDL